MKNGQEMEVLDNPKAYDIIIHKADNEHQAGEDSYC